MSHYKLALIGFGNVGQELARLLLRKQQELKDNYDLTFSVTAITTGSHGAAIAPDGIDLHQALEIAEKGGMLDPISTIPAPADKLEFIHQSGADALFENSPVNYETGQPAVDHIRTALELGMHALTANKGPVVHAYQELTALAEQHGRKFYFESTVMDGAPVFGLLRETLPAAQLHAVRGVLNSTTNMILTRMETGGSFNEAVRFCQEIGLAETDPSGDVDGWDAAIKLAALVTVVMGIPLKPAQVEREGIRGITPEKIAEAKAQDKRWKLVCTAERAGDTVKARVAPEMVGPESPLYIIEGSTSIVQFETDVLGELSLMERDPGPHTTAYGLLADFLNAVKA
jgi:homoserine dehydrogenase